MPKKRERERDRKKKWSRWKEEKYIRNEVKRTQKLFGLKRTANGKKERENGRKYEKVFVVFFSSSLHSYFYFLSHSCRKNMKIFMVFCALFGTRTWIEKLNSYHLWVQAHFVSDGRKKIHFTMIRFHFLLWLFFFSSLSNSCVYICIYTSQIFNNKWMPNNQIENEIRICCRAHF